MHKTSPLQKFRRNSFQLLLWLIAAVALLDLAAETYGLPHWLTNRLTQLATPEGAVLKVGGCYCGFVNGLRLENVSLEHDSPLGRLAVNNRMVRLRPRLLNLLKGNVVCDQIHLKDTKIDFINANDTLLPALSIQTLRASRTSGDNLDVELNMTHAGISANAQLIFSTWALLEEKLKTALQDDSDMSPEFQRQFQAFTEKYAKLMEQVVVGPKDSNLELFCEIDGSAPEFASAVHAEGSFQLDRVRAGSLFLNKCQGSLKFSHGQLYLKNLQWFLLGNEQISLSCSLDLLKRTISASYSGAFFPSTAAVLLTGKRGKLSEFLYCTEPVSFSGGIEESAWDWELLQPKLQLTLRNFYLFGTQYHHCTANLAFKDQEVTLQDLVLSLDYIGHHRLTGNLACHLQDKTFSADIDGIIPLAQMLRNAGMTGETMKLGNCNDTKVHLTFQDSPLTFPGLKGELSLLENELGIEGYRFQEAKATIILDGENLQIAPLALTPKAISSSIQAPLKLSLSTNLQKILDKHDTDLEYHLTVLADFSSPAQADAPTPANWRPALDAQGSFHLDLNERLLEMTDCQGTFNLEHLYALYGPVFELQSDILDVLHDKENQAVFHLKSTSTSLDNLAQMKFHGDIAAQDVLFDELYFRQATADFEFDKNSFKFHHIDADVNEDEQLKLTMEIFYPQLAITITDATVIGNPLLITSFIMDDEGRDIYQQIWTDLHWSTEHKPVFTMPRLHYFDGVGRHDWTLDMEGVLSGKDAKYGDFPMDDYTLDFLLTLPHATRVGPCAITTGGRTIDADFLFRFDGVSRCDFSISDKEGGMDLADLFKTSFPQAAEITKHLSIARHTPLSGKGFFEISSNPSYSFSANFTSPQCSYDQFQISDVEGTFEVNNQILSWNLTKAKFFNGNMLSTGIYDFNAKTVDVVATIDKLPIQELTKLVPDEETDSAKRLPEGNLDAQTHFKLLLNWVGKPTIIEGNGNLNISEGDLWKVPVLSSLGTILSLGNFLGFSVLSNLGTISELHSDFSFAGDRIIFQNMQTNGTIISLHGNGEYNWTQDQIYFLVIGEALAKSNFLNFILKPFTWYFEAELTGTLKENKWKPRNQFKRIFFN